MSHLEKLVHGSHRFLFNIDVEGNIYDDPTLVTKLLSHNQRTHIVRDRPIGFV